MEGHLETRVWVTVWTSELMQHLELTGSNRRGEIWWPEELRMKELEKKSDPEEQAWKPHFLEVGAPASGFRTRTQSLGPLRRFLTHHNHSMRHPKGRCFLAYTISRYPGLLFPESRAWGEDFHAGDLFWKETGEEEWGPGTVKQEKERSVQLALGNWGSSRQEPSEEPCRSCLRIIRPSKAGWNYPHRVLPGS